MNRTFLDFGCGEGTYFLPAAKIVGKKGQVFALDKSKIKLNELMRKVESAGLEKEKNITYKLTVMSTIVEADSLDFLLSLAKKMHQAVLGEKIKRVVTTIKIDDRKDKKISIEEKVRSVNP